MKELFSAFSTAVFNHLVCTVLPGLVALGGWFVYFATYPIFSQTIADNHTETAFITMLVSILIGTIIDVFGTRLEKSWLDAKQKKRTHGRHQEEWWAFLRKPFDVEPSGLRHLRRLVVRLKFELGVPAGLLISLPSVWINPVVSVIHASTITAACVILGAYLLFEAAATHALLGELRHQLLVEPGMPRAMMKMPFPAAKA